MVQRLTIVVILTDIFPGQGGLLLHLIPQMLLALLQHVQLRAQPQDSVLGRIFLSLGRAAAEPAEAPARHLVYKVECTQRGCRIRWDSDREIEGRGRLSGDGRDIGHRVSWRGWAGDVDNGGVDERKRPGE